LRALLYDVHGNLPALEAVVADARGAGASSFLLGGDYALFGPWPAETVAALRELQGATWIRGNVDRWTARPSEAPDDDLIQAAIADCREALGAAVVDELGGLAEQLVIDDTRYCHGSPISDVRSFMPSPTPEDDELVGEASEQRIVFGHTHLQFTRSAAARSVELVNPGSVGMPFDGDVRAAYAVLLDDGRIELRRVAYDHEASATAVAVRFGGAPWATRSARRLRSATMCD
jgi:diadenosine tetraphosphatase ApaH/serine/threonine PP2A family protein phosphatase